MTDARVPDPLDVLRGPTEPVRPSPVFAARLRARIERSLALPEGVTVSDLTSTIAAAGKPDPDAPVSVAPVGPDEPVAAQGALTPYLAVADARTAIEFYAEALSARLAGEPVVMPDGRIGHAELLLPGGARLMLAEAHPEIGFAAPTPGAGVSISLHLTVRDVDGAIAQAVRHGAELDRAPADHEYGRNAVLRDPFGHRWMVAAPLPQAAPAATAEPAPAAAPEGAAGSRDTPSPGAHEAAAGATRNRQGDVAYLTYEVVDAARTRRFYGQVLGWRFLPGSVADGWQVDGPQPMTGLHGGFEQAAIVPMYRVDDIRATVTAVRRAGGTATDPEQQPYGLTSSCTDDQGTRFSLGQL